MTYTVPADELAAMSREIATGIPMVDSQYANIDPDHAQAWRGIEVGYDQIKADGMIMDIVGEVPTPLLNEGYADAPIEPADGITDETTEAPTDATAETPDEGSEGI